MSYSKDPLFRRLFKQFPRTYSFISEKRYALPPQLVLDYMRQDNDCEDTFGRVIGHLTGISREGKITGTAAQAPTLLNWIHYGFKMVWLERDLGEMLLRTQILPDLNVADLNFAWESFRVMLPFGLVPLYDGDGGSMTSITISHEMVSIPVPRVIRDEFLTNHGLKLPDAFKLKTERLAILYSTARNRDDENTGLYCMWEPLDATSLAASVNEVENLAMDCSGNMHKNRPAIKMAKHLALNILIYLSSVPALKAETTCIRKAKIEGKHVRPAIHEPTWVGERVFAEFKPLAPSHEHEPTGRHLPSHWVCGHWRRRSLHDKKRSEQPIIWIKPYKTFGLQSSVAPAAEV